MGDHKAGIRHCLRLAAGIVALSAAAPALSQGAPRQSYDLEAQSLASALRAVSRATGKEILFSSSAVKDRRAPRLIGTFTLEEAITRLIAGSDLVPEFRGDVIVLKRRALSSSTPPVPGEGSDIVVTGTRIRGAEPASPLVVVTQKQMYAAGQSNLGEVARSLTQSFSGGQNPGVAGGGNQGGTNQNVNSSSTLNLRGIGADATLTLLNGHRLAYDSVVQGVDISAIPIAAVDRLEVLADGASAIYGSDAVGGVANIILKRDFSGLSTSARFGASTDGGNEQQQYDAVAGTRWSSGGVIGTFDLSRSTAIEAGQRSYTQVLDRGSTLVPPIKQYSAIASGHQTFGPIELSIDGTYNKRDSSVQLPSTATASYLANGARAAPTVEAFSVSPTLRWQTGHDWSVYLTGTYGESHTHVDTALYASGSPYFLATVDYDNITKSAELGAEGRLIFLPAGAARIAIGAGYRANTLDTLTQRETSGITTITSDFSALRDSLYAFGEASIPLVAPDMHVWGARRLSVTAAVRYEDYRHVARLATPKFGIIYSPIADLDLKGSWGKSFKAPTLYQQFSYKSVSLRPVSAYSAVGYPPTATALQLAGGNPDDLRPERATSWTATVALHPHILPGASLEVSYFDIDYRGRIIQPVQSSLGLLANPIYSNVVTLNPSAAQIAAALANAPAGLSNQTGRPFNAADIVAIVDNRQRNAARQKLHGVDLLARYGSSAGSIGRVIGTVQASYLASEQVLVEGQPARDLANTIFNPPSWRFRSGLTWETGGFTGTAFVSRTGGTVDNRLPQTVDVPGMTTLDLTAGYELRSPASPLGSLDLSVSVLNLFNAKPATIRQALAIDPTYDSTNYSVVGRFVSFSISKKW